MIILLSSITIFIQRTEIINLTERLVQNKIQPDGDLAVSLVTSEARYAQGQPIIVNGTVYNASGPTTARVILQVSPLDSTQSIPIYKTSLFAKNGTYSDNVLKINQAGSYKINIYASSHGENQHGQAYALFEVSNPFFSFPAYFLYGTIAAFLVLMTLIMVDRRRSSYSASIIHFLCLSSIALLPILSLIAADFELGAGSTIGLVIKPPYDGDGNPILKNGKPEPGGEWVLNVGGHAQNQYQQGIQVPINVIIFGIAGGYIRYLYKNAHLQITSHELEKIKNNVIQSEGKKNLEDLFKDHLGITQARINELKNDNPSLDDKTAVLHILAIRARRKFAFYQTLKDVTLFMLCPLLAIVVWFFLLQAGIDNPYVTAVVSFSVGLITEQVIETLRRFASNIMIKGVGEDKSKAQESALLCKRIN